MRKISVIAGLLVVAIFLGGCSVNKKQETKIRDVDFTVTSVDEVPEQVRNIVEEEKKEKFQTVYSDKENTYLLVGYGEQSGEEYSIKVEQLYETETSITCSLVFERNETQIEDTAADEEMALITGKDNKCYPYIIIKMEYTDKSIKVRNGY